MNENRGMQGTSDPNVELMDAAAFVSHLVPADSVYAFLAEHRRRLFPDEMFFPVGIVYLLSGPAISLFAPAVENVSHRGTRA